jgi:RNA polymerase sigma-70 factor (ECF subfamily)
MGVRMHDLLADHLAAHGRALRALAADLVGEQQADDLVQDAALAALRRPPARPGPIGGWLAAIVRHLASKRRRGERRRRERELRAARPEAQPPADAEVAARDAFARLTAAVLALPPAMQGPLLLRYVQELTPAEIAARTGAPVATVKSQLQRGLAQLRARLDADGKGSGWRGAFCSAFGIEHALPVAAAAAGAIVMGTGTKVVGAAAAALLAVLAWLAFDHGPPAARPDAPRASNAALAPAEAAGADARAAERRELADLGRAPNTVGADRALVRGRCVDERGQPLAGCEVKLEGWYGDSVLRDQSRDYGPDYGAWLVAHPDAFARDAATTTGGDGMFAFESAWAPLGFELHLRRDGIDHVVQHEPPLRGTMTDLGDLRVPTVTTLCGRVVDTEGEPVARMLFQLIGKGVVDPLGRPGRDRYHLVNSDARGEFSARIPAGSWDLNCLERDLVRGGRIDIPAGAVSFATELVVARIGATEVVAGVVIDDAGQPVPEAWVLLRRGNTSLPAIADDQGRFELVAQAGQPGREAMIDFQKEGYESGTSHAAWGTRDLRLLLRRHAAADIDLDVRAPDGAAVTDYRVWPVDGFGGCGLHAPLVHGHHEEGRTRLAGLAVGKQSFVVEPDRGDLARSATISTEVTATGPVRIEVTLPRLIERALHVQGTGGPAAGVTAELVESAGGPTSPDSAVVPIARWPCSEAALLVQRGTTDANGDLRLHGAEGRRVALRLSGSGHPRVLVEDALGDRSPLVVTLPAGARLEVRLSPTALVRQLRADNGLQVDGPEGRGREWNARGLRLRPVGEQHIAVPPWNEPPLVPAGDGALSFECVRAGSFELRLGHDDVATVATVELRDGETRHLDLDLPQFVRSHLRGRVLLNGNPLSTRETMVAERNAVGKREAVYFARTDADGRFAIPVRAGRVQVFLLHDTDPEKTADIELCSDSVLVPAGGEVEHEFRIDTGRARVRLLDRDGKAVAGVRLRFAGADGHGNEAAATGDDGMREVDLVVGDYTLLTFPRRLQSWRAQDELREQLGDRPGALAPYRLTLGTIAVRAGATAERTITLPPEFDR